MTVYSQIEANRTYFSGLSTDNKPTSTVQPGAIFIETDTLNQFIYTSAGTWVAYYEKEGLLDGYGNPIGSTNGILLTASYIWQPSTLSFIHASADSSGNLNVTSSGAIANVGNVIVTSGNVSLTAGTANIGNVNSYQGGAWDITGNVSIKSSTNNIGNVNVNNFPAVQTVSGAVTIAPGSNAIGNVVISNFPSTQTINGSVTVVSSNSANLLANVTVTNFPASTTVSGNVNIVTTTTALSPSSYTVNTASVLILASNTNRKGLILTNAGNNLVSLGFGNVAVANSGVTLYPGGTFNMDAYSFTTSNVNAIAVVANTVVGIQEWQ